MGKNFAVVVFDDEDGVEVAPICWVSDDGTSCRWPNDEVKNVSSLVKKCTQLTKANSCLYKCRVLYRAGTICATCTCSYSMKPASKPCLLVVLLQFVTTIIYNLCVHVISATYAEADRKADLGLETSMIGDSDDGDGDGDAAEGGRGKRLKT